MTLEGVKDIDNCSRCIVGFDGEMFSVYCQISGGTEPISVSIFIGNESFPNVVQYDKSDRYVVFFHLLNEHHGNLLRCLVDHDALESPMSVEALVYVISKYISNTDLSFIVIRVAECDSPKQITRATQIVSSCDQSLFAVRRYESSVVNKLLKRNCR